MSDVGFNLNPSFVTAPSVAPADAKPATGPIAPPASLPGDGRAMGEVRKGAIPATGDRLSLTVSPTTRGAEALPPDTALINAMERLILQAPQKMLAGSIGLTVTLAAAIKEAPGVAHHGEPDEKDDEVSEPEEDESSPQMPRLRRAGMRLSKGSKDEEGALSAF